MYRRNHLPFAPIPLGPMPIPISPFGGIPIAGVPYGFPLIINRPNNNNYNNNYNNDIDINIIKKQNGSMLTPADTNYLKTKIHMLQIIFNIILNNLCFKNSNNNNQLVNQIKNDIASNSTVSNHLSDLCLSGSNAVVAATAAAVPASVTQAANAVAVVAATTATVPTAPAVANTLIDVLVAAQAEVVRIGAIYGAALMPSVEFAAATAVYAAIEISVIALIKMDAGVAAAAGGVGGAVMMNALITTAINTTTLAIKTNINAAITPLPATTALIATAINAVIIPVVANPTKAAAITALGLGGGINPAILTALNVTPITVAQSTYIINTANTVAARYATTPTIVRKNPANQCFEPVFDDFKLHGLISSMRNNNFLRKACIYNSSRTGIDSNRIKINFAGGAYGLESNTQDENFNFINLLNILKEKDQSPDKTAILCVQTNGKLKCSNMKKKESTTECEFCERWTRERNMFRSVLKDLLEASDFNNTFDLMSASAYLLPSAIMDQKQYEQFYTAIDAYKKAKKEKK
jgi:hypothetical protein